MRSPCSLKSQTGRCSPAEEVKGKKPLKKQQKTVKIRMREKGLQIIPPPLQSSRLVAFFIHPTATRKEKKIRFCKQTLLCASSAYLSRRVRPGTFPPPHWLRRYARKRCTRGCCSPAGGLHRESPPSLHRQHKDGELDYFGCQEPAPGY